jgi:hypothetical protein
MAIEANEIEPGEEDQYHQECGNKQFREDMCFDADDNNEKSKQGNLDPGIGLLQPSSSGQVGMVEKACLNHGRDPGDAAIEIGIPDVPFSNGKLGYIGFFQEKRREINVHDSSTLSR